MKKVAITLMIILLTFIMCVVAVNAEEKCELYARAGIVVELDEEADIVYFEDFMGEIWSFMECEDWAIGDIVAVVMNTMGTELIYDDEIVSVTYNGYIDF